MGAFKQLAELGGRTMVEWTVGNVLASQVGEVVVVLGFRAEEVAEKLPTDPRLKVVVNKAFDRGMSSSLKAGLKAVDRACEAAVFILADQPLVDASVLNRLMEAYRQTGAPIVVPTYQGKRGNPVLIARSLFGEVQTVTGDKGAREVVERHGGEVAEVEIDTATVLLDVDTVDDLKKARALLRRHGVDAAGEKTEEQSA
jgi:molybdenum cofactor cytidylyltransferase